MANPPKDPPRDPRKEPKPPKIGKIRIQEQKKEKKPETIKWEKEKENPKKNK